MRVYSTVDSGFDGFLAEIECHVSNGLPNMIIVGFANKAVDEAKERVSVARSRQQSRFNSHKTNSQITNQDIKAGVGLTAQGRELLDSAAAKLELSPRAYMRTLKVARTIADLDNSDAITAKHVAEAVQYRPKMKIGL